MSNKKQSSVDWMYQELNDHLNQHGYISAKVLSIHINKARAMHREEVESAYNHGFDDGQDDANGDGAFFESVQDYYEQTFEAK